MGPDCAEGKTVAGLTDQALNSAEHRPAQEPRSGGLPSCFGRDFGATLHFAARSAPPSFASLTRPRTTFVLSPPTREPPQASGAACSRPMVDRASARSCCGKGGPLRNGFLPAGRLI